MSAIRRTAHALALGAALSAPLAACTPKSGPPTAAEVQQEQAQGRALLNDLREKGGIYEDAAAQSYLDGLLARVQRQRDPSLPRLQGHIVKDADVNAFTTGGGYVFVNAGLMAAMENEAQLAMVLAHESAHVDLGHVSAGRQTRGAVGVLGALASIGLSAAGVSAGITQQVVGLGAQAAVSSFTRDQEREADQIGARYHAGAGWNTVEGARSFEVLRRLYGDGGGFLSSHPASTERQQRLVAIARAEGGAEGEIGQQRHLQATARLRRDVLEALEGAGRDKEAAQIRRNLRATR